MNSDPSFEERMKKEVSQGVALKTSRAIAVAIAGAFAVLIFGVLLAVVIMYLWNWTLASMFGWPEINYWQAFGLFILAKIFFGFGWGGGPAPKKTKEDHEGDARVHDWWRQRMGMQRTAPGAAETPDVQDDAFKKYWQAEGKSAFEAYIAAKQSGEDRSKS